MTSLRSSGATVAQTVLEECTEAFTDKHRPASEEFGGVPRQVVSDSSGIGVTEALWSR